MNYYSYICGTKIKKEMNKELGHIIRNRRKDLGMTQAELAEKVSCNYATICNLERGGSVTSRYIFDTLEVLGLEMKINVKNN